MTERTSRLAHRRARRRAAHRQHSARRRQTSATSSRRFVDPWLARKDADWRLDELYDFVEPLGATVVRTNLSRSIIDVNRDPSGASLYPGQATTELCPTTTFDGEPLYREGQRAGRGRDRRAAAALFRSLPRGARGRDRAAARERFTRVALFDAHSIRSRIPRLFDGELPVFNLGTNSGASCSPGAARGGRRGCSPRAAGASSSTGASRAAGSPAPTGARATASKRCSSSSPAAPTWPSRTPSPKLAPPIDAAPAHARDAPRVLDDARGAQ